MNPIFSLTPSDRGPVLKIREQNLSSALLISLEITELTPLVGKEELVAKGQKVASDPQNRLPSVHSSVSGKVLDIKKDFILIEEEGERVAAPLTLDNSDSSSMLSYLRDAGIDVSGLKQGCTLIINTVPAEAGIDGHRFLIEEFNHIMSEGLDFLKEALSPKASAIAVPQGMPWTLPGCTGYEIKPVYPNGLAPMVVKAVTGKEMPSGVSVIDAATLYRIGRTVHGKQPVTEIMVKVGNTLFQTPVGTTVKLLTSKAGFKLSDGDRVVLGGPLSGRAVYSLNHGIPADTQGVTVIAGSNTPVAKDSPCLGCGECVIKCPARLMPNMISRHAEFGLFENTQAYFIASCFECGLCAYWCTAQRPLLQYIRLAKKELFSKPILEDLRK
ncbi:electron transport complex protein RnfC [Maridesulfovibrio ferrireducens]|uniref:Electron transport complex protein RnfC n=1 Tax=Maridesulfovibrio ferrireducens TaxID=246191 RepID=A0A1G9HT18_9BACT|nr:4Fe-4S dicluster domain-containing protein [Maridesulfovibrio ferrireducens]SDL15864.1 electron transport complex protein RnfC [Maridesulfovibrio ferrireducens]